jgi:hypothetical protein
MVMGRALLAVGIAVLAGCATSTDYTPQIHVTPGAAARVFLIASHRPRPAPPQAAEDGGAETAPLEATEADEDAPDGGASGSR